MRSGGCPLFTAVALALVWAAPAAGQADTIPLPDSVAADTALFRLQGVRVRVGRPLTTVGGASAVEIRLDSVGFPPAATGEEVLREVPGLHLRTNSRGQAEISARGSESRQVAVLLDGVPLTLGWDARTDVSVLPATALQEVSFVRGLSSVLHGPNVLGGVVEMSLARAEELPLQGSSAFSAGADHIGGYGLSATATRPVRTEQGRALVRAGLGYRDSPGMPLPDGVVEPVSTGDGLRLNTDMENLDGFLALRYRGDGGAWGSFSGVSHRAVRGIAAELAAERPRFWRYPSVTRTVLAFSGGTGQRETRWGAGDLEASVGVDVGRTEIRSYATRAYEEEVGREDGDDRTLTFRLLGDHTLGPSVDLRAALTVADISRDEEVDGSPRSFRQRLASLGMEAVWGVWDEPRGPVDALRVSAGAAYDRGRTPETGGREPLGTIHDWGGRVGLSALTRGGSTSLHLGVSRRGRFPALREAYSEALDRFVPNPDLGPETLVAAEAGVTSRIGTGEVQAVAFRHELTDAIRRVTFPDGGRQRVNSDRLTSTGLELLVSQSWGPVGMGADLTLQSVELVDPDTPGSERPENLPRKLGRVFAQAELPRSVVVSGEWDYTGSQFCQDPDTGEDVRLDPGGWINAGLRKLFRLGSGAEAWRLEARIEGRNLADTALYDQCGLPRAGRLFRVQLQLS